MNARRLGLVVVGLMGILACNPPLPATTLPLAAAAAVDLLLGLHGLAPERVSVYGLAPDPTCSRELPGGAHAWGFRDVPDGDCHGGLTVRGVGIWLLLVPGLETYSLGSLAHEVAHWAGHEHAVGVTWAPGSRVGLMVDAGRMALALDPEADRIQALN